MKNRKNYFSQRLWAALFAISLRCSGVSFLARALPPLRPPNRWFGCVGFLGLIGLASPVAIATIRWASWFTSFFGMEVKVRKKALSGLKLNFQTETLPILR